MKFPHSLRKLMLAAVSAAALVVVVRASASVEVGRPAPDFTLADIDGQNHSLADFRGKTVVLEWNNPGCPIVRKHYDSGNLPKLQREAMADGVVWLLVNSGADETKAPAAASREFKTWLGGHAATPTYYLRDTDGAVGHTYGAKTTPHMFVINASGVLVYQGAIDSIPSARKEDISKATNYVRNALGALKAGKPIEPSATKPYGCAVKYGS